MPARCFIALTLDEPVLRTLSAVRPLVERASPGWVGQKWAAATVMHLTLSFLGAVDDDELPRLARRLASAALLTDAFEMHLSGARAVPSMRRATMLWAVLGGDTGACESLQADLAAASGVEEERRPFHPHVTLVRARSPRPVEPSAMESASRWLEESGKGLEGVLSVRSATLFSSTLEPGGPRHEALAVFDLGGRAQARTG